MPSTWLSSEVLAIENKSELLQNACSIRIECTLWMLITKRRKNRMGIRLFGHTSFKPDPFSKRCFQLFVTFLPLIVVPKNANTLLLFIHDTIMFQNLFYKIGFSTLCRTHNQKWEFMAEVEFQTGFGCQRCRTRCCSWSFCGWRMFTLFYTLLSRLLNVHIGHSHIRRPFDAGLPWRHLGLLKIGFSLLRR